MSSGAAVARRTGVGEWLAAAAGIALIAVLFLRWYSGGAGAGQTGWEAFVVVDLLLAAIGLVGLAVLVVALTQRAPALPMLADTLGVYAGLLALLLIAFRALVRPEAASIDIGLPLAALAAAGVLFGGLLAMREERAS